MNRDHLSLVVRKPGFPTRSDKNRAAQPQKMARDSKFRILKVEGLYYLCGENKDADQLRSYCTGDLRLCFRICQKTGFLITRLVCYKTVSLSMKIQKRYWTKHRAHVYNTCYIKKYIK